MIYDYLPYLRPPLTNKEREEAEKAWQKLREYCARIDEIKTRLNEIGTLKPMLCHDEIEIEFSEEHQEEAIELVKELNAFGGDDA